MRTSALAAPAVPLLLLMLTWLSFHAVNADAEVYDRALQTLDGVTVTENALQRDLLLARSGVLRNYDPLVQAVAALGDGHARLREIASEGARTAATIDALEDALARQEALVEQFKSENALLQNSLAYFGLFSARMTAHGGDGAILAGVSDLAAAMLRLTLDTSAPAAREVEESLGQLAAAAGDRDHPDIRALLAHGRMLHRLLPRLDGLLSALFGLPVGEELSSLRAMVLAHQGTSRESARRYRTLLYVISLALLAALVHLGLQLRARARALQRRAALEHLIASLSLGFIDAPPQEVSVRIETALGALADEIGADRAYFLLAGRDPLQVSWCRAGTALAAGWPERALALAGNPVLGGGELLDLVPERSLPDAADRAALAAAGLRDWACVVRRTGEAGLLGFDAVRARLTLPHGERSLLRMAFDVFANAVGRERLERDRAELAGRLQQARRMETVGALTSGIAHNFNNIVGAILGYAEMAEAQVATGGRAAWAIGEIRRAGERARDLVDQILTFGRRRDARRRPVRVAVLLAECASLLRASLTADVDLIVQDVPPGATVSGEVTQLQQVVLNLCNNAAQAMDNAGPITVAVDLREVGRLPPETTDRLPPGRYIRIAVEDRGRGMDEATRARVFEPFFTTRPAGNGLGLATVREIVREHAGALAVSTEPGAGSRFEVWLPAMVGPDADDGAAEPGLPLGQGETLMVINPDPVALLRDEEVLAALGYEPVGFSSVERAIAAHAQAPERFAAALVGPSARAEPVLRLRNGPGRGRALPVVLAAGSAASIDATALARAGIAEIVQWPLVATEVAATLARCLARR
ncbi:two-component system VirA-like sensor kinase [Methylobacterium sp. ID0610]|uniref:two-component system VirA-like sensor kinase n=1 Tax=Methylobacterium carpenticola TaxID=3344827 RepID=UPI0036B63EE3